MTDSPTRSHWVIEAGQPFLPDAVISAAAEAQATLDAKLAELRAHHEPFPGGVGPVAADRWVANAGDPAATRPSTGSAHDSG